MRRYLTELIGTFFLVLTIGLTVLGGSELAPLAIGSVLMVMVYMGGHLSGAHYNPAVSLAASLRGKMQPGDLGPYMLSQLTGALLAAGSVYLITGQTFAPTPDAEAGLPAAVLVEGLFAFALALVVLNTATVEETDGNSYFGLAIGFTLAVGVFAGGSVSGGAFNPAVGIGPAIADALNGATSYVFVWIYVLAPLAGGALAALVSAAQHGALQPRSGQGDGAQEDPSSRNPSSDRAEAERPVAGRADPGGDGTVRPAASGEKGENHFQFDGDEDTRVIVRTVEEATGGRLTVLNSALEKGWRIGRMKITTGAPTESSPSESSPTGSSPTGDPSPNGSLSEDPPGRIAFVLRRE